MKKLRWVVILLSLYALSCSKKSSDPVSPPLPPVPPTPVVKLLKTNLTTFGGSSYSLDSFSYDNQGRATYYSRKYTDTLFPTLNFTDEYVFSYQGANSFPGSFTYTNTQPSVPPNPPFVTIMTNSLFYDSQNRLILDSTVYASRPVYSGVRVRHYMYTSNLLVSKTDYPNKSTMNAVDSFLYDGNSNLVKHISWTLSNNTSYTLSVVTNWNYSSVSSNFYNASSSMVNGIIYQPFNSRYFESSSSGTSYDINSNPTNYSNTSKYTLDSSGVAQKLSVTNSAGFGFTSTYKYY